MSNKMKITGALIGIIILNLFANFLFVRFDLTEGSIYTLSDATKDIAGSLPDNIEIKFFESANLPSQMVVADQSIKDKLEEYQSLGKGKIDLSISDPANDENSLKLAQALNIPEVQAQIIDKDELSYKKIYFGLAVLKPKTDDSGDSSSPIDKYDKYETIPVVQDLNNFEYDLTSILMKLSETEEKVVAFSSGHGEFPLTSSQQSSMQMTEGYPLQELLDKNYSTTTVDLTITDDNDPSSELENVDTLVIAGPTEPFTDEEAQKIIDFTANGGNVILLANRINIGSGLTASLREYDFGNILSNWGIEVEPQLVADSNMDMATFQQQNGNFRSIITVPYEYFVKVTNFNENNVATSKLESVTLPWANPLKIDYVDGVTSDVLASSSKKYMLITEEEVPVDTSTDDQQDQETQTIKEPINIDPSAQAEINAESKDPVPLVVTAQKEGQGSMIVIGDSEFLSTTFSSQFKSNTAFFMNLLDSLTLGDELIEIRSKGIVDRPIANITETQKNFVRWGNIIGVPLIFIAYGVLRKSKREKMKKKKM